MQSCILQLFAFFLIFPDFLVDFSQIFLAIFSQIFVWNSSRFFELFPDFFLIFFYRLQSVILSPICCWRIFVWSPLLADLWLPDFLEDISIWVPYSLTPFPFFLGVAHSQIAKVTVFEFPYCFFLGGLPPKINTNKNSKGISKLEKNLAITKLPHKPPTTWQQLFFGHLLQKVRSSSLVKLKVAFSSLSEM